MLQPSPSRFAAIKAASPPDVVPGVLPLMSTQANVQIWYISENWFLSRVIYCLEWKCDSVRVNVLHLSKRINRPLGRSRALVLGRDSLPPLPDSEAEAGACFSTSWWRRPGAKMWLEVFVNRWRCASKCCFASPLPPQKKIGRGKEHTGKP